MNRSHIARIAGELDLAERQVRAVAELLAEGATVPFLARYRKEATGSLDEVAIAAVRDRLARLAELDRRREAILGSLAERGLLTEELASRIQAAENLARLEDLYLPHRPKRRTRATMARERGLGPLAAMLLEQRTAPPLDPAGEAGAFVDPERGVASVDDALAGARDIVAETVSEDPAARGQLRGLFAREGRIRSRVVGGREEDGAKYRDYFAWEEPAAHAPSHRILAMLRGRQEGVLRLRLRPDPEAALSRLRRRFLRNQTPAAEQVDLALQDGYRRLLAPALETEAWGDLKRRADEEAIGVFAANLRELLLAAPLGQKRVLALDPGFRTGCKLVCLDAQGKLLHHDTVFPHTGGERAARAGGVLADLCERHAVEAIAVGNGTAGRETERWLRELEWPSRPEVVMVNESGASVYSASPAAREEFPDHDVTVRGAVSIGRRLMDPLAELVKIDPKAIGVGQYQHDVDQKALRQALDDVVASCVNAVGVDVNTASRQLLTYVSGLGPRLADAIVAHRDAQGPFPSRQALLAVPRLGPRAFEQAAGFLRIRGGEQPLDASAVHPERYPLVDRMAADLGCGVADLLRDAGLRARLEVDRYVGGEVGLPTLRDILDELNRPGRDPRSAFQAFRFAEGVSALEDLAPGMVLPGIVTNVTAFGAFVDVGVHQDGLVHVSQLAERYVRDPAEVVRVQQRVRVKVLAVDLPRRRIALSLKDAT